MKKSKKLIKAYKDPDFINSPEARPLRILSEFIEPQSIFRKEKVRDTIVFFGSARLLPHREAVKRLKAVEAKRKAAPIEIEDAEIDLEMSRYYEDTVKLSKMITQWSSKLEDNRFVVCSGGGPGIMEAANKGACLAGGKSIGLNISLPFEQEPNKYITDDLNMEFHYFFMRKFWFAYLAKALVIMPGGFGTFDELFEILTLVQTHKIRKKMPIIIYGRHFWDKIINFQELANKRVIAKADLDLLYFAETVEDAFQYLKTQLSKHYIGIKQSLFNLKPEDKDISKKKKPKTFSKPKNRKNNVPLKKRVT